MGEEKKVQRIEALKDLKEINFFYHVGLHQAHEKNQKICYMNALAPTELAYAMDIGFLHRPACCLPQLRLEIACSALLKERYLL